MTGEEEFGDVHPLHSDAHVIRTPEMVAERNRLRHEQNERVIAHYKDLDRSSHLSVTRCGGRSTAGPFH
jgi:hypothetical protein